MEGAIIFSLLLLPLAFSVANVSALSEPPPAAPDVSSVIFARAVLSNGSAVSGLPLIILARGNDSSTVYRTITDSSGLVILSLQNGSYEIDALLDMPNTPGMDFASTAWFSVPSSGGNATLIFYPAGSLAGKVLSNNAPVPGARVSVSCPSSAFDYGRINGGVIVQAGDAGDFLFRALPAGTCVVSASTDGLAGSVSADVEAGRVMPVSVDVMRKASPPQPQTMDSAVAIAIAIALLALAAIAFFAWNNAGRKGRPQPAVRRGGKRAGWKETGVKKRPAVQRPSRAISSESGLDAESPRAKAVLATLTEREREIVRFLFKSGGRAKRSQMQHGLLIPKTSLLRNLRSLERKNIVKLTPFGRNLLAEVERPLFQ